MEDVIGYSVMSVNLAQVENRRELLACALAAHDVQLACLFGSIVNQVPARLTPDVDLAVLFRAYSFENYLGAFEAACQALGTRRVDLVVLNRANALLTLRALLNRCCPLCCVAHRLDRHGDRGPESVR